MVEEGKKTPLDIFDIRYNAKEAAERYQRLGQIMLQIHQASIDEKKMGEVQRLTKEAIHENAKCSTSLEVIRKIAQ